MTEHVHEWYARVDKTTSTGFYCKCGLRLIWKEAEAMLNATERLSAEDAKNCLGKLRGTVQKTSAEALRAYADTLEGKP